MSTKKTIQINPELFKLSGSKTKKNREKKELTLNPIVSPNNLKNKLLKRIKEHKTKELQNTNTYNNNKNTMNNNQNSSNQNSSNQNYTDEFYGALDYLSDLSKKQKQQKAINNKTLKSYSTPPIMTNPFVSLDLPPELEEPFRPQPQTNDIFNVNYKSIDDVPYGCLKNGKKKTYREWKELSRATEYPELSAMVRPPTPPKKNVGLGLLEGATPIMNETVSSQSKTSREERLQQIRNKLRKLQDQESSSKLKALEDFKAMEKQIVSINPLDDLPDFEEKSNTSNVEEFIQKREEKIEMENPKKYLKKTVKRKYTLGKSDKLRRVAVLIKDRQTRKNIINTQKELKKTNITDVRKYLRQHGIIKVGSTCPPDILRKTFEAAMLTGEVTNINKETLLHNFLNHDSKT